MSSEQTIVITGANSGIGFAASRHFAGAGARVVMACRSVEKGQAAQRQIQRDFPGANTTVLQLDVAEMGSVHEFGHRFSEQVGALDILINNAGIAAQPLMRNSTGHEMQLATNYLGTFGLTGVLMPYFRKDPNARVVNVGSLAHRFGSLNVDDLNWETAAYDQWKAYANSKTAVLSYTLELNRRLQASGSTILALAAHPGFAATEIATKSESLRPRSAFGKWYTERLRVIIPSAVEAVRAILLAATGDAVAGGDYYGPGGLFEIGGRPGKARINPLARDSELAQRLWRASESMTGVRYLSGP